MYLLISIGRLWEWAGPLIFCNTYLIETSCKVLAEICVWVIKNPTALRTLTMREVTSVAFICLAYLVLWMVHWCYLGSRSYKYFPKALCPQEITKVLDMCQLKIPCWNAVWFCYISAVGAFLWAHAWRNLPDWSWTRKEKPDNAAKLTLWNYFHLFKQNYYLLEYLEVLQNFYSL